MGVFFLGICGLCVLYCGLYCGYCIAEKNKRDAISTAVMTTLAAAAVITLVIVA